MSDRTRPRRRGHGRPVHAITRPGRRRIGVLAATLVVAAVVAECGVGTGDDTLVIPAARDQAYRGGAERAGHTGAFGGDAPGIQWTLTGDTPDAIAPVPVGNTDAMVATSSGLLRLTGNSGDVVWQSDVPTPGGSPTVLSPDVVVVAGSDGVVEALGADTGGGRWTVDVGHDVTASPLPLDARVVVAGRRQLTALDADTGDVAWQASLPAAVAGSPAATEDVVVVADVAGHLHGFEGDTGTQLYDVDVHAADDLGGSTTRGATPAVLDDTVYLPRADGSVVAVDAGTGDTVWEAGLDDTTTGSAAVATAGVWVVTDSGTVVALDPSTGATEWTTDLAAAPSTSPVVTDGTSRSVLVATVDGMLHGLDVTDGGERWAVAFSDGDGGRADPVVVEDTILLGDADGDLVGIR